MPYSEHTHKGHPLIMEDVTPKRSETLREIVENVCNRDSMAPGLGKCAICTLANLAVAVKQQLL